MAKRNRLTNNSDETDIASLLSGDKIFSIPFFQRAYKWKSERLKQLNRDVLDIVDESTDLHFLGAIIIHGRRTNPSDPDLFDVIDGQQRITTLFLYLAAAVRTLSKLGEYSEAAGLFLKYLVIGRETKIISNIKLHPCKEDRRQLRHVFSDILSDKSLNEKLGLYSPTFLSDSGNERGQLRNNYNAALRFFFEQNEQGGLERVRSIYQTLLESINVVQIDVWDPTNGPKIFDSLNSRQEPMTIGDLVRNEIFSKVADEKPEVVEQIDEHNWQPFFNKFKQDGKNHFDAYFFPYGLIKNPNLKKSEVYNALQEEWRHIKEPQKIIESLSIYQNAFIDILCGTNYEKHTGPIATSLRYLWQSGVPGSTYPFLMQLSRAVKENEISKKDSEDTLSVIESFLIRRAVSGHEPTGLHAVFKRLWVDCDGKPNGALISKEIKKHKTVVWPNDDAFREAIIHRPLYGVGICNYVLLQYDRSLGGDQPSNIPWVEHVLPDKPSKEWFDVFTKEQQSQMKGLLANLIPLSQEMNINVSNKPYGKKRERYRKDSMFKSARTLAEKYADWTPETIEKRGKLLASWALKRWPS